jgi:membrane fusion protein, copper/silver efflux system
MKNTVTAALLVFLFTGAFCAFSLYHSGTADAIGPEGDKQMSSASDNSDDLDAEPDILSMPPGTVAISRKKQQLLGVRTGAAKLGSAAKTLRLLGTVAPDEERLFKVKAAVDGIIVTADAGTTGSLVKKGQQLASFFSPELYSAEQSFIISLSTTTTDRYSKYKYQFLQVQVTEENLRYLGMTTPQVEKLKKTGLLIENIAIAAPETGYVLNRNVFPELRFLKGDELYRIAKLDRVWIYADVYESEVDQVKPKATANVHHPQSGKSFAARVSNVLPLFDSTTRTLKVRLEVDNPEFLLRPDMFVDVELPVTFPEAVTVPVDAVLDSGLRKTVFVDHGKGVFEPREVETGWRVGDRIEIKKGLAPEEKIAVSGTFLIDSESRLELAAQGMFGTLSKDPVCGLEVSVKKAEKAGRKSEYKGKTYYFDSDGCKQLFDKEPLKFLEQ